MGSYSYITFNDYPIFEYKNTYEKEVVNLLFLPEDFIIEERSNSSMNKIVWGEVDEGTYTFKGFRQTAKICLQRLEIYGNSYLKAKKDFETARIISKEEEIYGYPIHRLSYKNYLLEISEIIKSKVRSYDEMYNNVRDSLIVGQLSIMGQNLPSTLYSILSVIPEDSIVEYDLSEVILGGWVNENEVLKINIEKIIVLTEGKTDVEFISKSLFKLYPQLSSYYHFMNFDEFKVESNASALVKLVTSLVASNIKHPILVLFDNDTTGIMEMKKLLAITLTPNFRVLKYPDLSSVKRYPTFGPTGIKRMNINGFACGIEMYLGIDVLTKDGVVIPVQWKAFNEKEKKYQGEISDKIYVQDKFRNKIKSMQMSNYDDIELILKMMFDAFK